MSFSISYWDLIKNIYIYLADTTGRGDKGWKHAQRQGEDRVTLRRRTLNICIYHVSWQGEGKKNLYPFYQTEFSRVVKPTWTYYFMFVRVCMLLLKTLEFISSSARFGIWSRTNSNFCLPWLFHEEEGSCCSWEREINTYLVPTYLPSTHYLPT